jgi:DDE superfamily endonuclease
MLCDSEALHPLLVFRQELYQSVLGHRKDSAFELSEAVRCSTGPEPLVRLSLAPPFRRRWASAPDALADGSLDDDALRALFVRALPPPAGPRPLWVIDASTWPRPGAATSPERTYGHRVAAGIPQDGVVPGWEYQWLVAIPEATGRWVLPLDIARRGPDSPSPTALALRQVHAVLQLHPPQAPRAVVVLDSGYDPVALACATERERVDFLLRLAKPRVFSRAPGPYRGRGAPRKHGPVCKCQDPATQGEPDGRATTVDPDYGQVTVAAWSGLHARKAPAAPFTVVRVQVERLPRRAAPPAPLCLAWIGTALPSDLFDLWRWYLRRFAVEHGFRFGKRSLGWTTIRPGAPAAADRWTWLLAAVFWQRWLARARIVDRRLPWERPVPAERLSPGRVRRAFSGLLLELGTPARAPKPRGKAPGRSVGQRSGPRQRYPVVRRVAKPPATRAA